MKTDAWKLGVLWGIIMLFGATYSMAQDGIVSIYKIDGLMSGTTVRAGDNLRFLVRFNNNTGQKCDVSNGFKLSSPDGAVWDSTTIDSIGPIVDGESRYFRKYFNIAYAFSEGSCDGVGEDTVGMIGAGTGTLAARQLPIGFNDSVYAITAWFGGDKSSAGKHICIDTAFYGISGTWVWVGTNLTNYYPLLQGLTPAQPYSDGLPGTRLGSGYCFDLYAPMLAVSETQLNFSIQEGTGNPPSQSFDVSSTGDNIGDHLSFTLFEAAPWLNKTPSSGTTPRNVLVSINAAGLIAGTYTDSIRVESAGAGNSPLYVRIVLDITSPAPTIAVNKSSLTFVGLEGGSDPAPQTFIVKNIGGGTLNWSLTNQQPWLSAAPSSGIDSTEVTASVSLTGLLSGDYYDTITVKDPAATNDSVRVAVKLSVGSSLPTIAVDSAVNHTLRISGSSLTFTRSVYVRNGGVGALTWSASENSSRIMSLSPTSGAAPESLHVNFKLGGGTNITYIDTVWVTSPEAVNSPYPVIFLTRIVDVPQQLSLSQDTVHLLTYLCSQGPDSLLPQGNFLVYNTGGSDPMQVDLAFESDLFTMPSISQEATAFFTVQATYPDLPAGVYYDTILVTSEWAANSPQKVIVRYERSAGTQWHIQMPYDSVIVTGQEQTGPAAVKFKISNQYPGCMPWSADEEIPWFDPITSSGNAPDWFLGLVDIDALTLGQYRDSMYIVVPSADNTPRKLVIVTKVWRFHGDMNWNGFVDPTDLTCMVGYLTAGSPQPLPVYEVGDVNCDDFIDLIDLSILVAYLTGDPFTYLCGNP